MHWWIVLIALGMLAFGIVVIIVAITDSAASGIGATVIGLAAIFLVLDGLGKFDSV